MWIHLLMNLGFAGGSATVTPTGAATWADGDVHLPGFSDGEAHLPTFSSGEAQLPGMQDGDDV